MGNFLRARTPVSAYFSIEIKRLSSLCEYFGWELACACVFHLFDSLLFLRPFFAGRTITTDVPAAHMHLIIHFMCLCVCAVCTGIFRRVNASPCQSMLAYHVINYHINISTEISTFCLFDNYIMVRGMSNAREHFI